MKKPKPNHPWRRAINAEVKDQIELKKPDLRKFNRLKKGKKP